MRLADLNVRPGEPSGVRLQQFKKPLRVLLRPLPCHVRSPDSLVRLIMHSIAAILLSYVRVHACSVVEFVTNRSPIALRLP
jgi:hypothetical protein